MPDEHDSIFKISIHAPREGSDIQKVEGGESQADFNPRSP